MKMKMILAGTMLLTAMNACTQGNTQSLLTPEQFLQTLGEKQGAQLVDVRTAQEFAEGHLQGAQNSDYNNGAFEANLNSLDKSKPVFVYCLSGGRSAKASSLLHEKGFAEVYDLKGGILAWRQAGQPVEQPQTPEVKVDNGMSVADFKKLLASQPVTLVDFWATWCGPCKQLKPTIEKLTNEWKGKITVLSIDTDKNPALADAYSIQYLPTLIVFNKDEIKTQTIGYQTEQAVRALVAPYVAK